MNNLDKKNNLTDIEGGDKFVDKKEYSVYIASDHAGFEMKEDLKKFLSESGWQVEDFGPKIFDQDDDYPDFVVPMAHRVASEGKFGIVICANGQGACIATNKIKGIRAATAMSPEMAKSTRADDDANILCLPAKFLDGAHAREIVATWLEAPFSGAERHIRRIKKVIDLEKE